MGNATDFKVNIPSVKELRTQGVFLIPGVTFTGITMTSTDSGDIVYYATTQSDDSAWEEVSSGTAHTFSTQGNRVRMRIFGNEGAALYTLKVVAKTG